MSKSFCEVDEVRRTEEASFKRVLAFGQVPISSLICLIAAISASSRGNI
jgi:hypothetical protein